ncbi:MAG: LysR family transcriptional regulator [Pseudomonadota bacterium]
MRLRQIEIFYHVYRSGTISGAARNLNVSQPSVSKVLKHTEDQLGIELFLRQRGRLIPTQLAHELFAEAQDVYHRLGSFNKSLENISNRRGGHIRLGVLPSLSLSFGPEWIAHLRAADRALTFELTTLHSAEVAPALSEKRVDLCLGFEPAPPEQFQSHALGDGRMVLVAPRPLAEDAQDVDLSIVERADFIGMRDSGPLGKLVDLALAEQGISPKEIVSAHTYHVAVSLVRKQLGLTITDQFTAYSQLGAGLHRYALREFPCFSVYAIALNSFPDGDLIARGVECARVTIRDLNAGIAALQPNA